MSHSVQMPALGESVTEGTVTRWLKSEGESVDVDEPLLEVRAPAALAHGRNGVHLSLAVAHPPPVVASFDGDPVLLTEAVLGAKVLGYILCFGGVERIFRHRRSG